MIVGIIIFVAGVAIGITGTCIWALCAVGDDENKDIER